MDGEGSDDHPHVDAHLDRCSSCRAWLEAAAQVTRRVRIAPAPPAVDLVRPVLARAGVRPTRGFGRRRFLLRACLAVIGLAQLAFTLAPLLGYPQELHVAHEVGAWDLAFGVALLTAAWSPRRAGGLVPMGAALLVILVTLTALDIFAGRATIADEGSHVVLAISLVLLWLLDRSARGPDGPFSRVHHAAPDEPSGVATVLGHEAAVRRTSPTSRRISGAA